MANSASTARAGGAPALDNNPPSPLSQGDIIIPASLHKSALTSAEWSNAVACEGGGVYSKLPKADYSLLVEWRQEYEKIDSKNPCETSAFRAKYEKTELAKKYLWSYFTQEIRIHPEDSTKLQNARGGGKTRIADEDIYPEFMASWEANLGHRSDDATVEHAFKMTVDEFVKKYQVTKKYIQLIKKNPRKVPAPKLVETVNEGADMPRDSGSSAVVPRRGQRGAGAQLATKIPNHQYILPFGVPPPNLSGVQNVTLVQLAPGATNPVNLIGNVEKQTNNTISGDNNNVGSGSTSPRKSIKELLLQIRDGVNDLGDQHSNLRTIMEDVQQSTRKAAAPDSARRSRTFSGDPVNLGERMNSEADDDLSKEEFLQKQKEDHQEWAPLRVLVSDAQDGLAVLNTLSVSLIEESDGKVLLEEIFLIADKLPLFLTNFDTDDGLVGLLRLIGMKFVRTHTDCGVLVSDVPSERYSKSEWSEEVESTLMPLVGLPKMIYVHIEAVSAKGAKKDFCFAVPSRYLPNAASTLKALLEIFGRDTRVKSVSLEGPGSRAQGVENAPSFEVIPISPNALESLEWASKNTALVLEKFGVHTNDVARFRDLGLSFKECDEVDLAWGQRTCLNYGSLHDEVEMTLSVDQIYANDMSEEGGKSAGILGSELPRPEGAAISEPWKCTVCSRLVVGYLKECPKCPGSSGKLPAVSEDTSTGGNDESKPAEATQSQTFEAEAITSSPPPPPPPDGAPTTSPTGEAPGDPEPFISEDTSPTNTETKESEDPAPAEVPAPPSPKPRTTVEESSYESPPRQPQGETTTTRRSTRRPKKIERMTMNHLGGSN